MLVKSPVNSVKQLSSPKIKAVQQWVKLLSLLIIHSNKHS